LVEQSVEQSIGLLVDLSVGKFVEPPAESLVKI
jgi:hypothetical protein